MDEFVFKSPAAALVTADVGGERPDGGDIHIEILNLQSVWGTNGVAITVAVQMQVLELSRLWDSAVAEVNARYRIQAHALSRQYLVKNLSTGEVSTYRDFEEMVTELGRIRDFPLLDDAVLEEAEQYRVRLRATLDLESLPTPLRLVAYFKPSWRLSSEWTTWALER